MTVKDSRTEEERGNAADLLKLVMVRKQNSVCRRFYYGFSITCHEAAQYEQWLFLPHLRSIFFFRLVSYFCGNLIPCMLNFPNAFKLFLKS